MGGDIPSLWTASTQGRAPNAHSLCTLGGYCSTCQGGAHWRIEARGNACHNAPAVRSSAGTVAPAEQVQRHAGPSANAPVARSLAGIVAPAEQAPA